MNILKKKKRRRKKSVIEEVFIHNETILKGLHCYLYSEEEIQTRKFRFKAFLMPMLHLPLSQSRV